MSAIPKSIKAYKAISNAYPPHPRRPHRTSHLEVIGSVRQPNDFQQPNYGRPCALCRHRLRPVHARALWPLDGVYYRLIGATSLDYS